MKKRKQPQGKQTRSNQDGFSLPTGMSYTKELLPIGWVYVFRDKELGQLGRLVLQNQTNGDTHINCEVAGDPDDPMTAQRRALLEPVTHDLVRRMQAKLGGVSGGRRGSMPPVPAPRELIESKLMQCETCDAGVALLIFADHATDQGGLEDCAHKMYAQITQTDLPTYVIGPQLGSAPPPERPANTLKVWPTRGPLRRLRPDEFNPIISALARAHCG